MTLSSVASALSSAARAQLAICPDAATTIHRERSVFYNVLGYAAELEELSANSLDRVNWKPPQVAELMDHRVVVNPRQARELLAAVTYVGRPWRGRHPRAATNDGSRLHLAAVCDEPATRDQRP